MVPGIKCSIGMDIKSLKIREIVTHGYIYPSHLHGYDYVINPYVGCPHRCVYCYAEFIKRFTNHTEPWGTFTDVKVRSTAVRPVDLQGTNVFLSSVTDCYNPLEEIYGITRKVLQQLRSSGAKITILTKSALVTRDIDIFKTLPDITVGFSMNTEQDDFRKEIEPFASSVLERLEALKTLHENGIKTWVHVAPLFPGITDWKALLETTMPYVNRFSFENLKLRADALSRVLWYLSQKYPELESLYQQIYQEHDMTYWRALRKEILSFCNRRKLSAAVYFKEKKEKNRYNVGISKKRSDIN